MHAAVHTQHIPIHRVFWERKGKKESKETEELGCVLICVCMVEDLKWAILVEEWSLELVMHKYL